VKKDRETKGGNPIRPGLLVRLADFFRRHAMALSSAVLLRLAFPKPSLYPLAFIALIPLVLAFLHETRPRGGFRQGLIFGFVFYYANIFWLNTIAYYNPFAYIGIFLIGLYFALCGGLFGLVFVALARRAPRMAFVSFAALWVFLEYLRSLGQLAFPWSYLSASQARFLWLIQVCDVTGVWGLSLLIALINGAFAQSIHQYRQRGLRHGAVFPIAVAVAALAFVLIYGVLRLRSDFEGGTSIRTTIIQPDITQKIKFYSYAGTKEQTETLPFVLEGVNYDMLQDIPDHGTDLVVLPEAAFTRPYFGLDRNIIGRMKQEARRIGAGILAGANREIFFDRNGRRITHEGAVADVGAYNSAWFFTREGELYGKAYDKMQLVPFGEHVPYFDLIPGFQRIIVQAGSYMKGTEYTLFPVKAWDTSTSPPLHAGYARFGCVICFESAFPHLFRRFHRTGADFMTIITNDAWYEDSAGPWQHHDLAFFRAVETRQWIVRCSNRGLSAIIAPSGRAVAESGLNTRAVLSGEVKPQRNRTVYGAAGDWLPWLCFIFMTILFMKRGEWRISLNSGGPEE